MSMCPLQQRLSIPSSPPVAAEQPVIALDSAFSKLTVGANPALGIERAFRLQLPEIAEDVLRHIVAGSVTYTQLARTLPDVTVDRWRMPTLVRLLSQYGVQCVWDLESRFGPFHEVPNLPKRTPREGKSSGKEEAVDPLAYYMQQVGQIPRLSWNDCILLGKCREIARQFLRNEVLESPFGASQGLATLQKVHRGELPFVRTMLISSFPALQIDRPELEARFPPVLKTIEQLVEQNAEARSIEIHHESDVDKIRQEIRARSTRIAALMEELPLRLRVIRQIIQRMYDVELYLAGRMTEDTRLLAFGTEDAIAERRVLRRDIDEIVSKIQERPIEFIQRCNTVRHLSRLVKEGDDRLVAANLRLCIKGADRYMNRGLSRADLIQEGNVGLYDGIEKWEYGRGYRISTHLMYWISQRMGRAILDTGRLIRLTPDVEKFRGQIASTLNTLRVKQDREPSWADVAEHLDSDPETVETVWNLGQQASSIDRQFDGEDTPTFATLVESREAGVDECADKALLRDSLTAALRGLTYKEREVLKLRYGLGDGYSYTLEECGRIFKLTRERIRQLQDKALKRLAKAPGAWVLAQFLETKGE